MKYCETLRNFLKLGLNVSLKLERGDLLVLTVNQGPGKCAEDAQKPRPIYRKISRYLAGKVSQNDREQAKKVSFCTELVKEREFAETESVVSSSAGPVLESSAENEEDDDILSELEEFEED